MFKTIYAPLILYLREDYKLKNIACITLNFLFLFF
nr:MAG TPA: hypothetical protein [Caudoviricetes sp.]